MTIGARQVMAGRVGSAASKKRPSERIDEAPARTERKPLPLGAGARMNARVVLALVLFGLAVWTAAGFLPALIWATILAVALWPLYLKFAARFSSGPSSLAAFIFTAIVALVLFTPMSLAVYQIAQQGDVLVSWLKQARESGVEVPDWVARLPVAAESLQSWWRANLSDPKAATAWLQTVNADNASEFFKTFGGQLLHRLFLLLFSLLTLFFLLRNGRAVASRFLETCDRLIGDAGEGLVEKMVDATRGTVNGTVLVAVGEGLLIGVGLLRRGRSESGDVYDFDDGIRDAAVWCMARLHHGGVGPGLRRRQRVRGRSRILLGRDRHACRRSFRLANPGRRLGASPVSFRLCRNLRRSRCLRAVRFVSGACDHGGVADRVARVDIPAGSTIEFSSGASDHGSERRRYSISIWRATLLRSRRLEKLPNIPEVRNQHACTQITIKLTDKASGKGPRGGALASWIAF